MAGNLVVVHLEPQSRRFVPASARDILRALNAEGASLRPRGDDVEYVGDALVPAGEYELVRATAAGHEAGSLSRTPEAQHLLQWLQTHTIDTSSLQGFKCSINAAPILIVTRNFFISHTHQLPELSSKCILGYKYKGARAFIRDDFIATFVEEGIKCCSIVVASAPRRTGKSMGCVNSLLAARKQVLGVADKLVVLATDADLPVSHLKTILCISMHCGLPMVLDELQDMPGYAKGFKAFAEDGAFTECPMPPLSVVAIGSDQQAIRNEALNALSGLEHMGLDAVTLLPLPSLGLIVSMLESRYPELQGDELAARVLSNLTRSGPNLKEHWASEPPTADQLMSSGTSKITNLADNLARVVDRMTVGSGTLSEQETKAVKLLTEFGFIRQRKAAGRAKAHLYDFVDYRLITCQIMNKLKPGASAAEGIFTAEGRVLEEVIRSQEGTHLLARALGLQEAWQAQQVTAYYGQLAGSKEVDMLLVEEVTAGGLESSFNLFLCSVKRSEVQQELASFTNHVEELYTCDQGLPEKLQRAKQITFVAVSCIPASDGIQRLMSQVGSTCLLHVCGEPKQQEAQQEQQEAQNQQRQKQRKLQQEAQQEQQQAQQQQHQEQQKQQQEAQLEQQHVQQQQHQAEQEQQRTIVVPMNPPKRVLFKDIVALARRVPLVEALVVSSVFKQ